MTAVEPVTSRRGFWFVGDERSAHAVGSVPRGRMYVHWEAPVEARRPLPLVLIHGGGGLVAARHPSEAVDFVAVDHSYQELLDAHDTIAPPLEGLLRAGKVSHGIDPSQNAIVIDVANSASEAQRRRLRAIADHAPVRVLLHDTDEPSLIATLL
jgi:hypothetical protein